MDPCCEGFPSHLLMAGPAVGDLVSVSHLVQAIRHFRASACICKQLAEGLLLLTLAKHLFTKPKKKGGRVVAEWKFRVVCCS